MHVQQPTLDLCRSVGATFAMIGSGSVQAEFAAMHAGDFTQPLGDVGAQRVGIAARDTQRQVRAASLASFHRRIACARTERRAPLRKKAGAAASTSV